MRLLQVMSGAKVGGAEAFFERLVPALSIVGIEQHAVIRHHRERAAALAAARVPVTQMGFGGPLDFFTGRALGRTVRAFRPDVVLSWMSRASRFVPGPRFRQRHPFVHLGRLGGHYPLKYYRHCDALIANTRGVADYIAEAGWPAARIRLIPNFVEAQPAMPVERAEFATPENVPLALALGRLHRNKAFDVLLRALAEAPEVWLWVAGEGPERGALRRLARRAGVEGRVRFLGWRDDVPALLQAADMLVCPSRVEPLGNIVLEAWACRRPVVAAAAAGPRELILDGKTGLLVPVEDASALAAAMTRVVNERVLQNTLADAGHAAYKASFTREAVILRYLDVFREFTS